MYLISLPAISKYNVAQDYLSCEMAGGVLRRPRTHRLREGHLEHELGNTESDFGSRRSIAQHSVCLHFISFRVHYGKLRFVSVTGDSRCVAVDHLPLIFGKELLCFISRLVIVRQFFTASARFFNPYEAMVPVEIGTCQQEHYHRTIP